MSDRDAASDLLRTFSRTGMYRTECGSEAERLSRLLERRGLVRRHETLKAPGAVADYWSFTDAGWRESKVKRIVDAHLDGGISRPHSEGMNSYRIVKTNTREWRVYKGELDLFTFTTLKSAKRCLARCQLRAKEAA